VARWLYSAGAAGDVRAEDGNGNTPMHSAGGAVLPWLVCTKNKSAFFSFYKQYIHVAFFQKFRVFHPPQAP
jgi:hypothetical protein